MILPSKIYECRDCGHVFSVFDGGYVRCGEPKPQRCPQCGSMNTVSPEQVSQSSDSLKEVFKSSK